ncbi:MAG: DUF4625 domain-containing protein [Bacteroidota bacterium]
MPVCGFFSSILFPASCQKEDIDDQKPVINLDIQDAFPVSCDTLYLGETLIFKALFTDNRELGSFSIEIHDNFDHHAHSTEVEQCAFDPDKEAVNPFEFLAEYEIPDGREQYETSIEITIPEENQNGQFDQGDYHFFIRLTDREGWSAQKGLSIKILKKKNMPLNRSSIFTINQSTN